jgi:hypothetical protein
MRRHIVGDVRVSRTLYPSDLLSPVGCEQRVVPVGSSKRLEVGRQKRRNAETQKRRNAETQKRMMTSSKVIRILLISLFAVSTTAASARLTRAEVDAQRRAAQAGGQLSVWLGKDSGSMYIASHFRSMESRDGVKTELSQAIKAGTLTVLIRGDSGSVYLSRHQMLRTPRSEVRAALATAEKNGTLGEAYGEDSGSFALSQERRVRVVAATLQPLP